MKYAKDGFPIHSGIVNQKKFGLKDIEDNKELNLILNIYNNLKVRQGQRVENTKAHATGLVRYVKDRYAKEIAKRSSDKGKQKQKDNL